MLFHRILLSGCIFILSACGGSSGGGTNNNTDSYTIGGTVTGLDGAGLVLQNNGGDNLSVETNGSFVFSASQADGSAYDISILSQPTTPEQTCSINNASSSITGSNVNDVLVSCTINPFPVLFDSEISYINELYVAESGNDISGDGSIGNPYATLAKAAQQATAGTRINMAAGTYNGAFISNLRGNSTAPIAIVANGSVTVSGANDLHFSKPRYIVIDGLTIEGSSNGLNIDDGSEVDNPNAAEFVIIKNSNISVTGSGNNDAIKASGVNQLIIVNNQLSSVGSASSAIDLVGSHNVVISKNQINNSPGSGIQAKGGSADIIIHGNTIQDISGAGSRAINAGGSTGSSFFRPPLISISQDSTAENFEAARIIMLSNIIINADVAVAYVGCVDCVFINNTIIDPQWYIVRILQESVSDANFIFSESQNGVFQNNIVRYSTLDSNVINIGSNTLANTFNFDNNLWWATNEGISYTTTLTAPVPPETASLYQLDPQFTNPTSDFRIGASSPALGQANENVSGFSGLDFDHKAYNRPPALGAFEVP